MRKALSRFRKIEGEQGAGETNKDDKYDKGENEIETFTRSSTNTADASD